MKCKYCQADLDENTKFCTNCGAINEHFTGSRDGMFNKINNSEILSTGNIAVQKSSFFKKQLPGVFNWGAFSITSLWALGNKLYLIAFLSIIPIVNVVLWFVAGFKGNEWAARNNAYRDMEEFSRVQESWNRAGFLFFVITVVIGFLYGFVYVVASDVLSNW